MHAAHADHIDGLSAHCPCGIDVVRGSRRLGCLECGAACCTACAITLESVAYCRDCATILLETTASPSGGRFEIH